MASRLTEVFLIKEIEVEDRTGWTPEHKEAIKTLSKVWPQVQRAMREIYGDDEIVPSEYRSGIRTQLGIDQLVPQQTYDEINNAVAFYMTEPWTQADIDKFEKGMEPGDVMKPHEEKFLIAVGTLEQAKGPPAWRNLENERVINAPDGKKILVVML